MSGYAVAQIDEIAEISDGRPWRRAGSLRYHVILPSMRLRSVMQVGDRLIN